MRRRLVGSTIACTDDYANFLYLSDLLKTKYKRFHDRLIPVLDENRIDNGFLPGTRDVWAKDYMPVQVAKVRFVQFRYEPDYLVKNGGGRRR